MGSCSGRQTVRETYQRNRLANALQPRRSSLSLFEVEKDCSGDENTRHFENATLTRLRELPPLDGSRPPLLSLRQVFGFSVDLHNSVRWVDGQRFAFLAESLAVVQSSSTQAQEFLGGARLESRAPIQHSDAVTAIAVGDEFIATGQRGKRATLILWHRATRQPKHKIKLEFGSEAVISLSFSTFPAKRFVALDGAEPQRIYLFSTEEPERYLLREVGPGRWFKVAWGSEDLIAVLGQDSLRILREGDLQPVDIELNSRPTCVAVEGETDRLLVGDTLGFVSFLSKNGPWQKRVAAHNGAVVGVHFAPREGWISVGEDCRIHLGTKRVLTICKGLDAVYPVSSDLSYDGEQLLIGLCNGLILAKSTASGKEKALHRGFAIEVKGACFLEKYVMAFGDMNQAHLWSPFSSFPIETLDILPARVYDELFPDGDGRVLLATRDSALPQRCAFAFSELWVVIASLKQNTGFEVETALHLNLPSGELEDQISVVRFAPSGRAVAIGTEVGQLSVFFFKDSDAEGYGVQPSSAIRVSNQRIIAIDWDCEGERIRVDLADGLCLFFKTYPRLEQLSLTGIFRQGLDESGTWRGQWQTCPHSVALRRLYPAVSGHDYISTAKFQGEGSLFCGIGGVLWSVKMPLTSTLQDKASYRAAAAKIEQIEVGGTGAGGEGEGRWLACLAGRTVSVWEVK